MKKTLSVLPVCLLFAFCSHKMVPPPPTGVSNINVGRGDSMVSADKAGSSYTPADRDWAYKNNRDTSLNGSWVLEGMLQANGSWGSTEKMDTMNKPSAMVTDTAKDMSTRTGNGKLTAAQKRKKRNALYESAKSRLKMDYKAGSAIDTSALEPYAYWKRTPMITFSKNAFNGNTGCNSMSGTVNYTARELQFGKSINTSKMGCMDYDESNFLSLLRKADSYNMNGNLLEIKQGATVLMTLKKG